MGRQSGRALNTDRGNLCSPPLTHYCVVVDWMLWLCAHLLGSWEVRRLGRRRRPWPKRGNLEQNYVNLFIIIIAEWIENGRKVLRARLELEEGSTRRRRRRREGERTTCSEKLLDFKIGEEYKFDFYWNVLAAAAG